MHFNFVKIRKSGDQQNQTVFTEHTLVRTEPYRYNIQFMFRNINTYSIRWVGERLYLSLLYANILGTKNKQTNKKRLQIFRTVCSTISIYFVCCFRRKTAFLVAITFLQCQTFCTRTTNTRKNRKWDHRFVIFIICCPFCPVLIYYYCDHR